MFNNSNVLIIFVFFVTGDILQSLTTEDAKEASTSTVELTTEDLD